MNGFIQLATPEAVEGFLAATEAELRAGKLRLTAGRHEPVVVFENADEGTMARISEVAARFDGRIVPATRYSPLSA